MKTKKNFGVMVFAAILAMFTALSLTACGNEDTGNGNGAPQTAERRTPQAAGITT